MILSLISSLILFWVYNLKNPGHEYQLKGKKYEFINFGNSHASFFSYKMFALEGKNVSIPGNSPFYFNSQYQHYKKNLKEKAVVTITLSYYSFGIESGLSKEAEFNNQFYFYLKPKYIRHYKLSKHLDLINDVLNKNTISIISGEKIERVDDRGKRKEKLKFQFYAYSKNNSYKFKNLNIDRRKKENYITKFHINLFNPSYVDANIEVLSKMIMDAQENGFKVALVTPPYSKGYSEKFSKEWLDNNFYNNINKLTKRFFIPYIDYSKSLEFQYNGLYIDPQHMNRYGKTLFTKTLLDTLSEYNYVNKNLLLNEISKYRNFTVEEGLIIKRLEKFDINNNKKVFIFLFNKKLKEHYKSRKVKLIFIHDGKRIEKMISDINESFLNLYVNGKVSNFKFFIEE